MSSFPSLGLSVGVSNVNMSLTDETDETLMLKNSIGYASLKCKYAIDI